MLRPRFLVAAGLTLGVLMAASWLLLAPAASPPETPAAPRPETRPNGFGWLHLDMLGDGDQRWLKEHQPKPLQQSGPPTPPEAKPQAIPQPVVEADVPEDTGVAPRPARPMEITTWNLRAAFLTLLERRKSELASLCQQRRDSEHTWTVRLCEGLRYAADKREITWKVAVRPDQATVDERLFTNFVRDDILNLLRVPRAKSESIKIAVLVTRAEPAPPKAAEAGLTEEVSGAPPAIARARPPAIKTRPSEAKKPVDQEPAAQPPRP